MTQLSVNINKFATLRNARGGNNPDLVQTAINCEKFGAQGITVHPRPDERHITYDDVFALKEVITTEYNIEGYPDERYMEIIEKARPAQATLVPDAPEILTSNTGWDTVSNKSFLKEMIAELKSLGVRTSIFINPVPALIEAAAETGTDRIEFYTGTYAKEFLKDPQSAIEDYIECAKIALNNEMTLNAGHDLDLNNLRFLIERIPEIAEVSIGHAIICDAIYLGLENTIQLYLQKINI